MINSELGWVPPALAWIKEGSGLWSHQRSKSCCSLKISYTERHTSFDTRTEDKPQASKDKEKYYNALKLILSIFVCVCVILSELFTVSTLQAVK